MKNQFLSVLSTALLAGLFTACSNAAAEKQSQVSIDGGAVGYPLHQAVAEEFHKLNPMPELVSLRAEQGAE